jgi:integrase
MAWLQTDPSGNFHLSFRFGGKKFKRSLKTKVQSQADGRLHRLIENIRLVESGRLEIPQNSDVAVFLLSDGRLDGKPKVVKSLDLSGLFKTFFDQLPDDALEDTTMKGMKIHQRHLERHLGCRYRIQYLVREDLQKYVAKRSTEPGIRGRTVSPTTIRKELATLRSVWNWALGEKLVMAPFPNKGLRYPKSQEKPRFQTWDEIVAQLEQGGLTDAEVEDLWDCLFLQGHEIDELLEFVRVSAAHPFIYPMVFTAAHTGARRSELLASKLCDFDATHMTIREKKRVKGKRSTRRVPVSTRLRKVLDDWRAIHPGGSDTFCMNAIPRSNAGRKGVEPISRDEVHDHFKRTLEGSQWEVIRGWHVFRHSFCSNCAMNGVDQRLIDSWVGHTSDEMRKRYRHLVPSHESEMLETVFS